MQEKNLTLNNPSGLHARPAKDFVQLAKGFEANVTIVKDGNEYNGKSLMKLLQAGLSKGDQLVLKTDGADEADALENSPTTSPTSRNNPHPLSLFRRTGSNIPPQRAAAAATHRQP